jgi:LmbE family N-acetylglucosaminyl deacetylase
LFSRAAAFTRSGLLSQLRVRIIVVALLCATPLLLLLGTQRSATAATSGPVLVVVAHPDDEALQMSGVMASAAAAGRPVYLAVVTNGDGGGAEPTGGSYCGIAGSAVAPSQADAARLSLLRDKESIDAMSLIPGGALPWSASLSSHIFFLGYPDTKLADMANATSPVTGATGKTQAFARSGSGANDCNGDYGFLVRGTHSPYTGAALQGDLDDLFTRIKPTDVYTHSTFEGHTDHREVARQVSAAAIRSHLQLTVHGTLIHPEGTDGCSVTSYYQWPNPSGNASTDPDARATPTVNFAAPPTPTCSTTPTGSSWGPAGAPNELLTVPASMQLTSLPSNLKYQIINKYVSQHGCSMPNQPNCGFLRGFVKKNEVFWTQAFGSTSPVKYKDLVLGTAGLRSFWRLDETSGVVAHDSGPAAVNGDHDGVDIDVPGLLTGDTDRAAAYTGSDGTDTDDVYDFTGHEAFSLEAWVKPTSVTGATARIFSKEAADAGGSQGYYLANSTQGLRFLRMNDAVDVPVPSGTQVLAGPALEANKTYHVVVTDDGATMRMYVNGTQVASSPDGVALKNTGAGFRIGAKSGGGTGTFTGTIDEAAVYNAALPPSVITSHYLTGSLGPTVPDTTAPAKPATPTASAGNGQATINLSPLNGEADLASYTLQRKLASAGDNAWANVRTGVTTWPVTDTGLTNGTAYQYRVIALDASSNQSTPSNAVTVTPTAPAVIVTPPAGGGGGSTPPPVAKDTTKPILKISIAKAFARASVFKSGLKLKVSCNEACSYKATLSMDGATAKKLHISKTLATAKGKLTKAGSKTIRVKLSKKVQKALKRLRKTTIKITTKATDLSGNSSSKTVKTVLK